MLDVVAEQLLLLLELRLKLLLHEGLVTLGHDCRGLSALSLLYNLRLVEVLRAVFALPWLQFEGGAFDGEDDLSWFDFDALLLRLRSDWYVGGRFLEGAMLLARFLDYFQLPCLQMLWLGWSFSRAKCQIWARVGEQIFLFFGHFLFNLVVCATHETLL